MPEEHENIHNGDRVSIVKSEKVVLNRYTGATTIVYTLSNGERWQSAIFHEHWRKVGGC